MAQEVFKILYASEGDFSGGEGGEPQDEEM